MHTRIACALVLLALASSLCAAQSCDYTIPPSSGIGGIKDILDIAPADSDLVVCLNSGSYSATSSGDMPVDPDRMNSVTIRGNGMGSTTLDLNSYGRFMYTTTAGCVVTLEDLTIRESATDSAIELDSSDLTLTRVRLTYNDGDSTTGIINCEYCTTVVTSCEFEDNYGAYYAGGIYTYSGTLNITDSLFRDNTVTYTGGALYTSYTTTTIINSLLEDNSASTGDGIYANRGSVTLANSLVNANAGQGIYSNYATIDLVESAVTDNGNYGVYNYYGSINGDDSLLCANADDVYCYGGSGNLCSDSNGGCSSSCLNEFYCPGYQLANLPYTSSWTSCDSVCANLENECTNGTHNCHANATCSDLVQGFECECDSGYVGDGVNCTKLVNECDYPEVSNCTAPFYTCVDTPYSFFCDYDECAAGTDNCHEYATCTDIISGDEDSFACACVEPYGDAPGSEPGLDCVHGCNRTEFADVADVAGCSTCLMPTNNASDLEAAAYSASPLNTVCLGAGTYSGFPDLYSVSGINPPAGITFRGAGPTKTFLNVEGKRAFYIDTDDVEISDMAITNAGYYGTSYEGVGVYAYYADNLLISNVHFTSNTGDYGGVLYLYYGSSTVEGCTFTSNSGDAGGVIYSNQHSLSLRNSNLVSNRCVTAAIYIYSTASGLTSSIQNVYFGDNSASSYSSVAGIYVRQSASTSSVSIDSVVMEDLYGYAFYFYYAYYGVSVSNTIIQGAYSYSSRILYSYYSAVDMDFNSVAACEGSSSMYCSYNYATNDVCNMPYYSSCATACAYETDACVDPRFPFTTNLASECPSCFDVCGDEVCADHATCGNEASSSTYSSGTNCVCEIGFSGVGDTLCSDIDECNATANATELCGTGTFCNNTLGSFVCTDVDECSTGAHDCLAEATCVNTYGSFVCECPAFTAGDGVTNCTEACAAGDYDADCDVCLEPTTFTYAAISSAYGTHDIVCLGEGTFSGWSSQVIVGPGPHLTLRGSGRTKTLIQVSQGSYFVSVTANNVEFVLSDLTVTGGGSETSGTGTAVVTSLYSIARVSNVLFQNYDASQGVVAATYGGKLFLTNVEFDGCNGYRPAVYSYGGQVNADGLYIHDAWSYYGAVYLDTYSSSYITNNTLANVHLVSLDSASDRAGIYADMTYSDAWLFLTNVVVEDCTNGYALYLYNSASVVMDRVIFADNYEDSYDRAIYNYNSKAKVVGSTSCLRSYQVRCLYAHAGDELCSMPTDESCVTACETAEACLSPIFDYVTDELVAGCPVCETSCGNGTACGPFAVCTDNSTSTCECRPGYSGDPYTSCTDADECTLGTDDCNGTTPVCVNTFGSFTCADLNECSTGVHNCDPDAVCVDSDGSFSCYCKEGFYGDGVTCSSNCEAPEFASIDTSTCDVCISPSTSIQSDIEDAFNGVYGGGSSSSYSSTYSSSYTYSGSSWTSSYRRDAGRRMLSFDVVEMKGGVRASDRVAAADDAAAGIASPGAVTPGDKGDANGNGNLDDYEYWIVPAKDDGKWNGDIGPGRMPANPLSPGAAARRAAAGESPLPVLRDSERRAGGGFNGEDGAGIDPRGYSSWYTGGYSSSGGGGGSTVDTVCLGAGDYSGFETLSSSSGIRIPSYGTVRGAGELTVIDAGNKRPFYLYYTYDVTISNLTVINTGTSVNSYYGVFAYVYGGSGTTIEKVSIDTSLGYYGAIYVYYTSYATVRDVTCTDCDGYYASFIYSYSAHDIKIKRVVAADNYVATSYAGVIHIQTASDDASLEFVHVHGMTGSSSAAALYFNTDSYSDVDVDDVLLEDNYGYGIRVYSAYYITFRNVMVYAHQYGNYAIYTSSSYYIYGYDVSVCAGYTSTYCSSYTCNLCSNAKAYSSCSTSCAYNDYCVDRFFKPIGSEASSCGWCDGSGGGGGGETYTYWSSTSYGGGWGSSTSESTGWTSTSSSMTECNAWWCDDYYETSSDVTSTYEPETAGAIGENDDISSNTATGAVLAAVLVPLSVLLCCGFCVGGAALFASSQNKQAEPDMEMYSRPASTAAAGYGAPAYTAPPGYGTAANAPAPESFSYSDDSESDGPPPPRYAYNPHL